MVDKIKLDELKAKLDELEEAIKVAESFDLPLDKLYEQEKGIKDEIKDLEQDDEVVEDRGNQDAPFRRVLLLLEINKDDLEVAINSIHSSINRVLDLRYFEAL